MRGRPSGVGDRGSMPLALLVTVVGVTLSALLSALVIGQIHDTRHSDDRVTAANAAQAGLDVALARIRAAYDRTGGNQHALPCGPLAGPVDPANAATDPARYSVQIDYYLVDPSGYQDRLDALVDSRVACVPTTSGAATVPVFAMLRSTGRAAGSAGLSRLLFATYTFHTTSDNIPGGNISVSTTLLCLGSEQAEADPGHFVRAVPCSSPDAQTRFIYPKNLTLVLASTRTAERPLGLCLSAPAQGDGVLITFQQCAVPTDFHQQWAYDVNGQTYRGTSDGRNSSPFCFNLEDPGVPNSRILLRNGNTAGNCGAPPYTGSHNFVADPRVGSGGAGPTTGQFVSRKETGRCLDLTLEDVNGTWFTDRSRPKALISYPCKQAFDGNGYWNHHWYLETRVEVNKYTVIGRIYTIPPAGFHGAGVRYCIKSPGAGGGWVWVVPCSDAGADLDWTLTEQAPLTSDSFAIRDRYGFCLQPSGPDARPDQMYLSISEIITLRCDGLDLQKWNVPAAFDASPLKDLGET